MTTVVFPGKFDPISMGHLDIIKRANQLFDRVVVAVYETPSRPTLFSTDERKDLISATLTGMSGVEVDSFSGLLVDYVHAKGAQAMLRGLRLGSDFEYEFEMALMNRKLAPGIDVVCLITSIEYQFVRSSLLKEVAELGGDISGLAPSNVITALSRRLSTRA
jgi:pantetheine-phosphate adenylyltransferase